MKETRRRWLDQNKERTKETGRLYYQNTPANKRLYDRARDRAKRANINFDLDINDIIVPEYCPVLQLKLSVSSGIRAYNSPSLDRIDPSKGYTKDNIKVVSWRANHLKSNGTISEFEKIIRYMKNETD